MFIQSDSVCFNMFTGLDKRQCTVGLTLRGAGTQHIAPSVIFRGTGKKIPQSEKDKYPSQLNIMWQINGWEDSYRMIGQLKHFRICRLRDGLDNIWSWQIMDNDTSHVADKTKDCAGKGCLSLLTYTPANCTDAVSVVDRIAHLFKYEMHLQYEQWATNNFDIWENQKTTAGERRILMSNWIWSAWNNLIGKHEHFIHKMFQQCGILLRKDGSDKHLIHIPGIEDYFVSYN